MSKETAFKTTQIGIFNPGRLSDHEIERAFITRIKLFEYLLQGIVSETPGTIPQHYLVIGQRGMGKSTLLHRIAVELRKEPHRKSFLPLTFPEEQYNVDRLSKFWLNCLDALADALDREGSTDQLDQLDQDISRWASTARDSSAMQLYEYFAQWLNRTARRPVLLVDNLGLIFDRLSKEEQHQLRAILMDKDAPILVGASANTLADTVDYGAPFYDAFQTQYLKKLTFEEIMEVLENLAQITDNSEFATTLRGNRPRLRTLYQLTGGTPRTIVMLYPLIRGGFSLEVQTDLEGLMDVMTPLYKARFEELPEQMQVILDAVALHWDPIALDDLRQITQLENPQLSPQLKRLYEVGWLERLNAYEKKGQAYEISERFFNIWYLMRRSSRRQKKELLCLTKFLVTLYGEELNQMGERVMQQEATHRDHVSMQLAIADGVEDYELACKLREKSYKELFELSRKDASVLKDFDIPEKSLNDREESLFEKVRELFALENWSETVLNCEEIIRLNPKNTRAWQVSGYVNYKHLHKYLKAENAFKQAIKIDPEYAAPWNSLGDLYQYNTKQYLESEEAYLKAIELDEQSFYWHSLGRLYQFHLNRYLEAKNAYIISIELDDRNSLIWNDLGLLFEYHFGQYKEAKNAYLKAIELNDDLDFQWHNLGNLYQNHFDDYDGAEQAFKRATTLNNQSAHSWNSLGILYQNYLKRNEEAKTAYQRAIGLDGDFAYPWYGLGKIYQIHKGNFSEAEKAYKKAIILDDKFPNPWNGLGSLYQDYLNRYSDAEVAYLEAIKLDKNFANPWNNLGNLYQFNMTRYEEAEAAYKQAIELDRKFADPWIGLGYLYQNHIKRFSEAELSFHRAIELNNQNPLPLIGLGKLYQVQMKRYSDAETAYRHAIELDDKDAISWNDLGNLYQDCLGRYSEAEEAYKQAIKLDGLLAYPWNNLGNLYKNHLIRFKDAEAAYKRATELDKNLAYPWNGLGGLYHEYFGLFKEAETAYLKALELGEVVASKINLIFLYRDSMNRQSEAIKLFEEMEVSDTYVDSYWLNASLFALYDKNLGIAEKHLLQALHYTEGKLPPNTQDDWWRFAAVSIRLGYGQAVLGIFQQNGYDVILRPYFVAIQSLVAKDSTAFLNSIAAEVREVAADLAERIKRFV